MRTLSPVPTVRYFRPRPYEKQVSMTDIDGSLTQQMIAKLWEDNPMKRWHLWSYGQKNY